MGYPYQYGYVYEEPINAQVAGALPVNINNVPFPKRGLIEQTMLTNRTRDLFGVHRSSNKTVKSKLVGPEQRSAPVALP